MASVLSGFATFVVFNRDVFASRLRSQSAVNTNQIQPSVLRNSKKSKTPNHQSLRGIST